MIPESHPPELSYLLYSPCLHPVRAGVRDVLTAKVKARNPYWSLRSFWSRNLEQAGLDRATCRHG